MNPPLSKSANLAVMKMDIGHKYLKIKRELFDKYYEKLNPKQREAVYTVNGPLLVLAGAGSGKTTVLVNRIAHIIRYGNSYYSEEVPSSVSEDDLSELEDARKLSGEELGTFLERFRSDPAPAWSVLGITFTNKAAGEIRSRIEAIFGNRLLQDPQKIRRTQRI